MLDWRELQRNVYRLQRRILRLRPGQAYQAARRDNFSIIRNANDLLILHPDLATIQMLQTRAEAWLATICLNLKVTKTRITHTLHAHEGNLGFDFLGFTVRQFRVRQYHARQGFKTSIRPSKANQKRQQAKLKEHIYQHRGITQHDVITTLNPKIRGWANYYRACSAKRTFVRMDDQLRLIAEEVYAPEAKGDYIRHSCRLASPCRS